jgi:hypothetical protein
VEKEENEWMEIDGELREGLLFNNEDQIGGESWHISLRGRG